MKKFAFCSGISTTRVADAASNELFRLMTSLSFRPEAIGTVFNHPDDRMASGGKSGEGESGGGSAIERFIADRADPYEFAVKRTTDETGTIVTHFPRTGFELKPVAPSNQESV